MCFFPPFIFSSCSLVGVFLHIIPMLICIQWYCIVTLLHVNVTAWIHRRINLLNILYKSGINMRILGVTPECRTHEDVKTRIPLHKVGVELSDPPPAAWTRLCSGSFGCQFKSNRLKRRALSWLQRPPTPLSPPCFSRCWLHLRLKLLLGRKRERDSIIFTPQKTTPKEKCKVSSQLLFFFLRLYCFFYNRLSLPPFSPAPFNHSSPSFTIP